MNYDWITPSEHIITVRDRKEGYATQHRVWNRKVIENVLARQNKDSDVYITKYPSSRLVECIILDFDSKEDIKHAYKDVTRMRNYLMRNNHNCVIVRSGSKGYHLYIQIAPVLFKDTEYRYGIDWREFFEAFVCFLIHDNKYTYDTLDEINFRAGLNGNIRLIGSIHPVTGEKCEIIDGEFINDQLPTHLQDRCMRKAYSKLEIVEERRKQKTRKTKIVNGNDPIQNNDLRDVFRELTGDIKLYPRGYGYCCCPFHNDSHPSLLVTKEWYSCSSCMEKGNIFTLRKKGLVKFDGDGKVKL